MEQEIKYLKDFDITVSTCGQISAYRKGRFMTYRHQVCKLGYHRIAFTAYGKRYGTGVHRLVAKAFIPNPENKPDVNHLDGNKSNNHVSNLAWVTESENTQHSLKYLDAKPGRPANTKRISEIVQMFLEGKSRKELAKLFGMNRPALNSVIRRQMRKTDMIK